MESTVKEVGDENMKDMPGKKVKGQHDIEGKSGLLW